MASWTAPNGNFDNYTLQRQEIILVAGSTFFANIVTLGGNTWLPASSTTYTDSSIIPAQTYEYRVAAVQDDQVGAYTDWFRVGPPLISLGGAPANFRLLEDGARILDYRRENWLGWDSVPGADDYEVQVSTGLTSDTYVVTTPDYFMTAFERLYIRVRGRKLDADLCATAEDDRCLTEWSGWHEARFTPKVTIPAPTPVPSTYASSTEEFRMAVEEVITVALEPIGTDVDPKRVISFMVLVGSLLGAGLSLAVSWRRGMAPLGVGMGAAILILMLFTGHLLLGTPIAWPIAAQVVVAVTGLFALVRQFGVFR